jgi:hypothetical protein
MDADRSPSEMQIETDFQKGAGASAAAPRFAPEGSDLDLLSNRLAMHECAQLGTIQEELGWSEERLTAAVHLGQAVGWVSLVPEWLTGLRHLAAITTKSPYFIFCRYWLGRRRSTYPRDDHTETAAGPSSGALAPRPPPDPLVLNGWPPRRRHLRWRPPPTSPTAVFCKTLLALEEGLPGEGPLEALPLRDALGWSARDFLTVAWWTRELGFTANDTNPGIDLTAGGDVLRVASLESDPFISVVITESVSPYLRSPSNRQERSVMWYRRAIIHSGLYDTSRRGLWERRDDER